MNPPGAAGVQRGMDDPSDARALGRGLAGLRVFFGLILFANGLAKLFSFRTIDVGPYSSFLINREETRQILDFEVNKRNGGTDVPGLETLANDDGRLLRRRPQLRRWPF